MPNDPIADALKSLHAEREALQREVNRLSQAIIALQALDASGVVPASVTLTGLLRAPPPGARPSVKQMMLRLLYEQARDWSVNEILAEYESRGTPIQAKDPSNALRAAVAEANKAGTIMRTAPGRYKAAAPGTVASFSHPESDPNGVMDEIANSARQSIGHNRFEEGAPR